MAVAAVLVVVLAAGAVLYANQRALIYYPPDRDPGSAADAYPTGVDVVLRTADGLKLKAWFVKPTGKPNGAAVLHAHGNSGPRRHLASVAGLADLGYSILQLEYRGYGKNPGSPSEEGLLLDAQAGAAWLRDQGFAPSKTIYYGASLGTGVVAGLATTDPPAAILLRSPFTSLADVADTHLPPVPLGLIITDRFDTFSRLPRLAVPITVLCGDADSVVPVEQSRAVADHARTLFRFEELPGVGHNDRVWNGKYVTAQIDDLYRQAVKR